jgi:hypothetical protein
MKKVRTHALINLLGFLVTIVLNGLANGLPINGKTTGELSDMYPNLFVPAGVTFAIWGLIYTLMLVFIVYQFLAAFRKKANTQVVKTVGIWYFVSSLANALWIVAWHYELPALSLLIMIAILVSLLKIYLRLVFDKSRIPRQERIYVFPLFSIYLGWICVATIANVTAVLVDAGWDGGLLSEATWAIIMIAVAIGVGLFFLISKRDYLFTIVVVWALYGIYLKRSLATLVESGVILATQMGMALCIISMFYLFLNKSMNARR